MCFVCIYFFKQKTAYEMRISDWSSDVCSSDLDALAYVQARNFSNIVISSSSFRKVLDQRNTPSTGFGGKIELRPPVGAAHVLRLGTDLRIADGQMFENAYSGATGLVTARRNAGGRSSTLGFFAADDWTLGKIGRAHV